MSFQTELAMDKVSKASFGDCSKRGAVAYAKLPTISAKNDYGLLFRNRLSNILGV